MAGPSGAGNDPFVAFQAAARHLEESFAAGDYPQAEDIGRAALDLGRRDLGENAQVVLRLQTRLATVIENRGRRAEALKLYRDAWERWRANYLPYNPYYHSTQMEYARLLGEMGGAEEALPLALESLRFAEAMWGPDQSVTVIWRWNVAGMYDRLGYADEALQVYLQTLDHYRKTDIDAAPRRAAVAAQNIAVAYADRGQRDLADSYWREAMARFATTFGADHPRRIDAELIYVLHAYGMGRHDEAGALLQNLEPRVRRVFGPQSAQMFTLREDQALLSATRGGDLRQAAALMKQSAQGFETLLGPKAEKAGHAWLNLSAMLTDLGDHKGALDAAFKAEAAGNASRSTLYLALYNAADSGVIDRREAVSEVFRISQTAYSNMFKEAARIQGARLELRGGLAEAAYRELNDLGATEEAMRADLLHLTSLPAARRDTAREAALRDRLAETGARIDALIDVVRANEPAGAAMIGDGVISLDAVQGLLGPDEALVIMDFPRLDDDQADILAVTQDDFGWWLAGTDQVSMRAAATDLRASIDLKFGLRAAQPLTQDTRPQQQGFDYHAAHFLYRNTFARAEDLLTGKTHVYVELRGALSGLPPQLLVKEMPPEGADPADVHWMVRDHAITVIPSPFALKVAQLARDAGRDRKPLLGFADPDFGKLPEDGVQVAGLAPGHGVLRGALAPLPETRMEVAAVAEALGSADAALFTGAAASERVVKQARLDDYRVLYFATHGLVAGDYVRNGQVAEPALALTAGDGEDGLLTSSEIARLRLDADLVVLSACNTALGGEPGAEALSGLAQAFAYAGARALMVSHWPVESRSAVALMTDIFGRRAADDTLGLAQAQRQAILAMLDSPRNPDWRHPAYWAPFVIVGSAE